MQYLDETKQNIIFDTIADITLERLKGIKEAEDTLSTQDIEMVSATIFIRGFF